MIQPGAIPSIDGDLEAVAASGAQLRAQGQAVADTGSDVHSTWQGLAAVYEAPEAGQLLAATAPVQTQAQGVGSRMRTVGQALVSYADEVRPIKAELERLRASASAFTSSVQGDEDWRSDGGKVDEHNALLSGVSSAVAAWMEAQRRCANTINAVHGGVQYVADDGDGVTSAGEFGYDAATLRAAGGSEQGLPWGRAEEEDLPWYQDAGNAVLSFGKGVVVDGLWGAVQGIGTLVNPWSDDFGAAWSGLGRFALAVTVVPTVVNHFTALPGLEKGALGQTLVDAGKGIVAWDTWKSDPARALGATLTNVVTAVIGTKGAGAGLKGGSAAARTALAAAPRLADVRAAVAAQLAKIPKIEMPSLNPALAGGGAPGPYRFDVENPRSGGGGGSSAAPAPVRPAPVVPPHYAHLPVEQHVSGQKHAWNDALDDPKPDTVYEVDGRHVYVTDGAGRVTHVQSQLEYTPPATAELSRSSGAQLAAGGPDRLQFDQGGHLVAASLGGPGEGINLVAMAKELNGAGKNNWWALEADWRKALKADPGADIRVSVEIDYPAGGGARPSGFEVRYSINGGDDVVREFEQ